MKYLFLTAIISIFLFSCDSNNRRDMSGADPNNHKVKAIDVVQTSAYTYIYVDENGAEYWIAVTAMDAREGEVYYFTDALEMSNFYSKELDWNFDKIYFVGDISTKPIPARSQQAGTGGMPSLHDETKTTSAKKDLNIQPREGSITIAELYANRKRYDSKVVKLVGEVTRFNAEIMNRNWVHIQDGSSDDGNYDITITTNDFVRVGDQVIVEGKLTLDKDFGAGYFYSLIVENAKVDKLVVH